MIVENISFGELLLFIVVGWEFMLLLLMLFDLVRFK